MAITLLLDTLGSEDASGLSQVDACAVYTLACLGVIYGMRDCRYTFSSSCLSRCLVPSCDICICTSCVHDLRQLHHGTPAM